MINITRERLVTSIEINSEVYVLFKQEDGSIEKSRIIFVDVYEVKLYENVNDYENDIPCEVTSKKVLIDECKEGYFDDPKECNNFMGFEYKQ